MSQLMGNKIESLSPEQLAILSEKLKKVSSARGKKISIQKRNNPEDYPMSSAQKRLWFLNQLNPGSSNYNIFSALKLVGNLNIEALEQALNEVIKRHEILRSAYSTKGNEPFQTVAPFMSIKLKTSDISELTETQKKLKIQKHLSEEANRPFDLSKWPLIRGTIVKVEEHEYILILVMHHIIADGWSFNILINELMIFYKAHVSQRSPVLEDLSIQYSDFAQWQNEFIQSPAVQQQLLFWKNKLQGMPQTLELPLDNHRPSVKTFEGARLYFEIPKEITEALVKLSRELSVTQYMMFLAAFQVFLYRITGQEDFGIGIPIANRNRREIEGLIGFFVNTMVIRADLKNKPTFREVFKRVKEYTTEAYDNQDLPFDKVVEAVQTSRDISSSPLFQVMFDLQDSPLKKLSLPDLSFSLIDVDNKTSKVDLLLIIEDDGDSQRGILEYDTSIFQPSTIEMMARTYKRILRNLINNPDLTIDKINLLEKSDEHRFIFEINDRYSEYPNDVCVHRLFENTVELFPDRIAVEENGRSYTYDELNQKANQLARFLLKSGAGANIPVVVFMERSFEMIVSIIAVLKTGGIYVPIDTGYPKGRLDLMFNDVKAPLIVTKSHLAVLLPETKSKILQIDEKQYLISSEETGNLNSLKDLGAESLAYIIYTSGSTGIPKGVAVTHKGISRLVLNTNYISIDKDDRISHLSNVTFDAATFEIWGALLNGAAAVIISKDDVLSTRKFIRLIQQQKITLMFITTALFNQIVGEDPDAFCMMKTLLFGGEMADIKSVLKVLSGRKPERLCNMYGPTECTTYSTYYLIESLDGIKNNIPIGGTISNSTLYVLDKNLQVVPAGVHGELYIGGDGLADRYIDRPELTAEKFIPDPFSSQKGARLYKTGDLVSYLPDGNIEFIGRIDSQIKLRGFRIELGEIESVLKKNNLIKDAVVLLREDVPGDKKLTAYIITEDKKPLTVSSLRAHLSEKLPEYMIPSYFINMDTFPTNLNGKIDKKALPKPSSVFQPDSAVNIVEARTSLEKYLANIWQEVLGIEKVGIYDNFFELGGNSIQAAVVMNRIQKEFSEEAHVKAIFLAPTVAELALYINEYYPDLTKKIFGESKTDYREVLLKEDAEEKVTYEDIEELKQIIKVQYNTDISDKKKNPRAIFLLSPPRSGSTLLRVMLAGNPKLFSPPELELLSFNTLGERKSVLSNEYNLWLEAVIRAVMELKCCSIEEAENIMESLEREEISVKEFYGIMQTWMDERLLVDKTPSYSLSTETLRKAEEYFEEPLYIHLLRHPYASIYSFVEAKLDKTFFRYHHRFSSRKLAELIWIISHQNIIEFLKNIPEERKYSLRFEDLLQSPEDELKKICRFIGVEYSTDMMKPYEGRKMTDPVRENSQMVGDYKFYLRNKIDQNVAGRWKKFHFQDFLSETAWGIAENYGYINESNKDNSRIKKQDIRKQFKGVENVSRDNEENKLSYAQRRLWFLDQLEPNNPFYNISAAFRLLGDFNEQALVKSVDEIVRRHEVLRTTFPSFEGKPLLKIHGALPYEYKFIDISSIRTLLEQKTLEIINAESRRPFDIAKGPLLRVLRIKEDEKVNVLVIIMHHIVSDGWSMGVLFNEITHYYHSFRTGENSPLPALSIQYRDYAHWQKENLEGEKLQKQSEYWMKKLEGIPKLINLPLDFPRPSVQNHLGDRIFYTIPKETFASIVELSNKNNVTPFMTLVAAFQVLLYKYTGQTDICLGTPIAGRNIKESEQLIGFFANTVVLRGDLSGNPSFEGLLKETYNTTIEALSNQELPFEKLLDILQVERDMSHTPIFQVMLSHNKSPLQNTEFDNLKIVPIKIKSKVSKFDLLLEVTEKDESFKMEYEYNTDLFKESTIKRMAEHFSNLLSDIIHNPAKKVSELQILSKDESEMLIKAWNLENRKEAIKAEAGETFAELFESQVKRTPGAIAVEFEGSVLTFNELNKKANQLAHFLKQKGAGSEKFVAVCLHRSIELITAIVAILKSGAAYVPLDPLYPKARIKTVLKEIPDVLVITQAELMGLFADTENEIVLPWEGAEKILISTVSEEDLHSSLMAENPAYMIFTSGSTGVPKGVVIPHNSLINLFCSLKEKLYSKYNRKMRISLNAPVFFDASMQQIVMLLDGHSLIILPQEVRLGGRELLKYVQENKIEVLDCVPSQLKLLIDAGLFETEGFKPSVCLPGGEAIEPKVWNMLQDQTDVHFYNMYGPTECTVDSIMSYVNESSKVPNIGRPVYNTSVYIIDQYLNPVPQGIQGEICLSGSALGRGYYNHPEMTADKYIPNPFGASGERMYKTGDLGRFMDDGTIEYLGRADHQVKIRGFRIEIGEIENALRTHTEVKEALVDTAEDTSGNKRLVAYISFSGKRPENAVRVMREYLKSRLPDYMVPSIFIFLDEMPLTLNGKIDRKKLPKSEHSNRPELNDEYQRPETETEEKLAKIWKEVLHINEVSVNDNFFELGGDSIMSIQVIAKANQCGLKLNSKHIFIYPTIKALAQVAAEGVSRVKAEQGLIIGDVPLTPIQVWFFEHNFTNKDEWTQANLFELSERLEPKILQSALDEIIIHNDMLRANYIKEGDEVRQVLAEKVQGKSFYYVLLEENECEINVQVQREIKRVQSEYMLGEGSLLKMAYMESRAKSYLYISAHHLIIDSVSWRIILEDLWEVYKQLKENGEVSLPKKTTSFKAWSERLHQYAKSEKVENEADYWIKNIPKTTINLPLDFNQVEGNTEESSDIVSAGLEKEETELLLHKIQIKHDIKINEVLLSALYKTISAWTGANELFIDMESHGREQIFEDIDLSRTVGWFTSLYPVYLKFDIRKENLPKIAAQVRNQIKSIPDNGISFGLLRYLNQNTSDKMKAIPLPEITFNYLGQFNQSKEESFKLFQGINLQERNPKNKRTHLLDFSLSVIDSRLIVNIRYSRNIHTENTIKKIATDYIDNLNQLIISLLETEPTELSVPAEAQDFGLNQEQFENLLDELDED